jgi:hypothetical protein
VSTALAAVTIVVAPPARATSSSWILQTDVGLGWNLSSVDLEDPALPKSAVTSGLVADYVSASDDGRVVAVVGSAGPSGTPYGDAGHGLLVSVAGSTRLVATVVDAGPVVTPDGASVYFISDGDLYHYDVASRYVSPRSSQRQYAAPVNGQVSFSVSPGEVTAAVVFRTYATTAPYAVISSQIKLIYLGSLVAVPLVAKTFPGGAASAQAYPDAPQWSNESNVVYGVCATGSCTSWKHFAVDTGAGQPWLGDEVAALEDSYDVRRVGSRWWFWKDSGSPDAPTSSMSTSNQDFSSVSVPLVYPYGSSTGHYLPVSAKPAGFGGTSTPLDAAVTKAGLVLSDRALSSGGRIVVLGFADYLRAVGDQTLSRDALSVYKGSLQYSTDGKRTWRQMGSTSSDVRIPFPGQAGLHGNARTTALTRNTWLRWTFAGDAYAARATSPALLVTVRPALSVQVKKKGLKRVVSGTVRRSGGMVLLYKGSRKLASARVGRTGGFRFGARALARGTYTVKVTADSSWASAARKFKV